jgi:hypothetical protein
MDPDMRVPSAVVVGLLAAAVGSGAAACGSGAKPAPAVVAMAGETVATSKLQTIAGGICDAARQAPGDLNAARQTFFGTSHDGIHLIARGLEEKDRAAAATRTRPAPRSPPTSPSSPP